MKIQRITASGRWSKELCDSPASNRYGISGTIDMESGARKTLILRNDSFVVTLDRNEGELIAEWFGRGNIERKGI